MSVLSRWWLPWRRWAGARIREIRQTSQRRRSGIPDILIFRDPEVRQDQASWHKSDRHHRGGDQVFQTFLSSGILKFVRIRLPDINPADITEEEIRYSWHYFIFRNPEVRQDQASWHKSGRHHRGGDQVFRTFLSPESFAFSVWWIFYGSGPKDPEPGSRHTQQL